MNKGLGFIRNIHLSWLDSAAEARLHSEALPEMRAALDNELSLAIRGLESRRKTIDVLVAVWHKTASVNARLHDDAIGLYPALPPSERIWLHYGLTLLYYPFFRQNAAIVGRLARTGEPITRQVVKRKVAEEIGQLGSLSRASERIVASLVDWGILVQQARDPVYLPQLHIIGSTTPDIQEWLLACALFSHPSEQLPFSDAIRLPELFPFKFTITLDTVKSNRRFAVQRQGMWDMVSLRR